MSPALLLLGAAVSTVTEASDETGLMLFQLEPSKEAGLPFLLQSLCVFILILDSPLLTLALLLHPDVFFLPAGDLALLFPKRKSDTMLLAVAFFPLRLESIAVTCSGGFVRTSDVKAKASGY